MLISCDCSVDVDEDPELYNESLRTARKQHTCCECGRTIEPGEQYQVAAALWDGEWATFKTCLGCSRIRNRFCPGGFIFGELAEQIKECVGFNYVSGVSNG